MKFFPALRLLGFFIGAALQVFLFVAFRRSRKIRKLEFLFLGLISCLFLWNLGNFLNLLFEPIEGTTRLTKFLLSLEFVSIAYGALGFVPSLLLHIHLTFCRLYFRKPATPGFRISEALIYVPTLLLPWALIDVIEIFTKRSPLTGSVYARPFATWFSFALLASAFLESRVFRRSQRKEERRLLGWLMGIFVSAAVLLLYAYWILGVQEEWDVGFQALLMLWPIIPSSLLGYAISRYSVLNVSVPPTVGYSFAAVLFLMIYMLFVEVIRNSLTESYPGFPDVVVDAGMILALFAFSRPVRRWIDASVNSLFSVEISKFQRLSSRLDEASRTTVEVNKLLRFIEGLLQQELGLTGLQIVLFPPEKEIPAQQEEPQQGKGFGKRIPLSQGPKLLGEILLPQSPHPLSSQQQAGLKFLVTQIVVAIETCKLTEGKVLLERELAERDKLATLGQMATSVAHNIKNPLSSIKTIVQLMQEDPNVGSKYSRDLSLINSEIDRLTSSVTQLLKFSKPVDVVLKDLDLLPILQKVVMVFRPEAEQRGILLNLQVMSEPMLVRGSDGILTEVFENLVVNALEASPNGSNVIFHIEIQDRDEGTQAVIGLDDEGPGIPPDIRQHIFKPFFTTKQKGTGLGLAVTYRRVMDLGGHIDCISPLGINGGTRFIVTLPLVK